MTAPEPNFLETDISHISSEAPEAQKKRGIDKNLLLDIIRAKAPLSLWHLREITKYDYSSLWRTIRDFEFAGLVKTETLKNVSNRKEKVISIPGKQEAKE